MDRKIILPGTNSNLRELCLKKQSMLQIPQISPQPLALPFEKVKNGDNYLQLPKIDAREIKMLWFSDYWDGPLKGILRYQGKEYLYHMVDHNVARASESLEYIFAQDFLESLAEHDALVPAKIIHETNCGFYFFWDQESVYKGMAFISPEFSFYSFDKFNEDRVGKYTGDLYYDVDKDSQIAGILRSIKDYYEPTNLPEEILKLQSFLKETWFRRYLIVELTPDQLKEERDLHDLSREKGDNQCDLSNPEIYRPTEQVAEFNAARKPLDLSMNKVIGWFEQ